MSVIFVYLRSDEFEPNQFANYLRDLGLKFENFTAAVKDGDSSYWVISFEVGPEFQVFGERALDNSLEQRPYPQKIKVYSVEKYKKAV